MIAGWILAVASVLGILGALLRISYLMGQLVTRLDEHVKAEGRIAADHEKRLRTMERRRPANP